MRILIRARRPVVFAVALALAAILPACGGGGGGGNNPTPVTQPPAPVRTQIAGGTFTLVGVPDANRAGFQTDIVAGITVTVSGAGTVEIVADWTFASNDVDILWFSGPCTSAQALRDQCTVVARTLSVTQKPERLTITNVSAGTYGVGFRNFGATAESGNFQVFLTR